MYVCIYNYHVVRIWYSTYIYSLHGLGTHRKRKFSSQVFPVLVVSSYARACGPSTVKEVGK